jgi:hypothetical protein
MHFGCALSITMVLVYTHLGRVSLITVIVVTVLMFVGIFSRVMPSQALMSAIPEITKRGSFNAVNASVQQISGGFASVIADLQHFDRLGYIVVATTLVSLGLMYFVQRTVAEVRRSPGHARTPRAPFGCIAYVTYCKTTIRQAALFSLLDDCPIWPV